MYKKEVTAHYKNRLEEDIAMLRSLRAHRSADTINTQIIKYIDMLINRNAAQQALCIDEVAPLPSLEVLSHIFYNATSASISSAGNRPLIGYYEMLEAGHLIISRMAGISRPRGLHRANFTTRDLKGSCDQAEGFFRDTLTQVRSGKSRGQKTVSTYHNMNGEPVAIRKYADVSSALTLKRLKLGPLILPPGTIVGIQSNSADLTGTAKQGKTTMASYLVNGQLQVTPCRLSPWVYDNPVDRALFGLHEYSDKPFYSRARADIAVGIGIDDFREAAHKIMMLCGVAV
jgi:hypothetical protein